MHAGALRNDLQDCGVLTSRYTAGLGTSLTANARRDESISFISMCEGQRSRDTFMGLATRDHHVHAGQRRFVGNWHHVAWLHSSILPGASSFEQRVTHQCTTASFTDRAGGAGGGFGVTFTSRTVGGALLLRLLGPLRHVIGRRWMC
jgi:hypothetical protein